MAMKSPAATMMTSKKMLYSELKEESREEQKQNMVVVQKEI